MSHRVTSIPPTTSRGFRMSPCRPPVRVRSRALIWIKANTDLGLYHSVTYYPFAGYPLAGCHDVRGFRGRECLSQMEVLGDLNEGLTTRTGGKLLRDGNAWRRQLLAPGVDGRQSDGTENSPSRRDRTELRVIDPDSVTEFAELLASASPEAPASDQRSRGSPPEAWQWHAPG